MSSIKEAMVESGVRCPACLRRPHDPSVLWFANEESFERCADAFHSPKREDPSWKAGDAPAPPANFEWNTAEQLVKNPSRDPFDPHPPKLETGGYGFRMCLACSTVVDASVEHECGAVFGVSESTKALWKIAAERDEAKARAEFAEDLINRVAFAHGCDLMGQYDQTDPDDAAARLANNGWAWPLCATDTCPFCDAARGE